MIRSRALPPQNSRTGLLTIVTVLAGLLALPAAAVAAGSSAANRTAATKLVRYRGVRVRVPSAWPVFRLGAASSVCVRFNRHAVYLGRPGVNEICPRHAAGRTEAILLSPSSYGGRLTPVSRLTAGPPSGSLVRIGERGRHVVVTATWGEHPGLIRRALGLHSLRAAMLATNGHIPRPAVGSEPRPVGATALSPRAIGHELTPGVPATPGEVYVGLGFDTCTTQSEAAMAAWGGSSPYGAVGIYIGGANAACLGGNLTASWVSDESAIGWHMIPLYVGLQAPMVAGKPSSSCGGCAPMSAVPTTAATEGTAAALDAVAQAQVLGLGPGNPIYFDMENYSRSTTATAAVLAFLQAWTAQLHTSGYLSGVYSSGSSGVSDLVANYGTTFAEPDELWTASWDPSAPVTPPTSTANAWVPSTYWPNDHQLLQYYSDAQGTAEAYGGVKINIDRDFVDAATAAAGTGTLVTQVITPPAITVAPQPDGSVELSPSWAGEPGITQYAILAGSAATALTPIETVPATTKFPMKLRGVYAYYEVQALNSLGQVVGTSPPVQTPASLAIFGHSAFVAARGPVGVPVACLNTAPCQVQAAIFYGKRRITHTGIRWVPRYGGQLMFSMTPKVHQLVATALHHRLPVTMTLTNGSGAKITRPLNLISYTTSGRTPIRHTWASSALKILGQTSFVSNAWTGGVLAVCRSSTPCEATTRVTLGGRPLAEPRTQTLGSGEIGYLTYRLTAKAHALLRAAPGNQLGARVKIATVAPSAAGGAPATGGASATGATATTTAPRTAMALVSLVSFR